MTAKEARRAVDEKLCANSDSQYKVIKAEIKRVVENLKNNDYFILVYDRELLPPVRRMLEAEGYTIATTSDARDGTMIKISF